MSPERKYAVLGTTGLTMPSFGYGAPKVENIYIE